MAEVFNDKFDSGDASAWNGETNDAEGDGTVAVSAAMNDASFGYECRYSEADDFWLTKNVTTGVDSGLGAYRYRFWFDPNSLTMAAGDHMNIIANRQTGRNFNGGVRFHRNVAGDSYAIQILQRDDGSTTKETSILDIPDQPVAIEVLVQNATGQSNNDGYVQVWVDDVLVSDKEIGSLDLWTRNVSNLFEIGQDPLTNDVGIGPGTWYLGNFIIRNDATLIGSGAVQGGGGGGGAKASAALIAIGIIK